METAPSHETPFYDPAPAARLPTGEAFAPARSHGPRGERLAALLEVLLCSGVPTQLAIGQVLALGGWSPFTSAGVPQAGPLFALALLDTIVLLVLIAALLRARGESMYDLLLGKRPAGREAWRGLALVPVLFLVVGVTLLAIRRLAPWLHNVPSNPYEHLINTTRDAGLFSVVAIVAGGLREEVQRAFLLRRFSTHLGGPGVADVRPPVELAGGVYAVDVISEHGPLDERSRQLVEDLREIPGPALATGATAGFLDLQDSLAEHLPLVLAIVVVVTFVVLFLMTGSVVLPLKQIVMNALGLSATFGILVLIFQDGRLENLLGYTSQGGLESTQPLLLFAVVFGLSTDYGVFLLSRIKEARDGGYSDSEAVAVGLERTGRIVTAAALLFSVAIGAFVTSQVVFIKELGLGTAIAVLIDATIIRALLVPSLMEMLGRWNWWAPAPLRRLHRRIGLSEA